jgi:REP element-mobilizing transposase RayT
MLSEFVPKTFPKRKSIRLREYDYSQNGSYFITFCVENGTELLGTVGHDALGVPCMQLSEYGDIISEEIAETPSHYENITVPKYVVMPNHVHMIIEIANSAGTPRASCPTVPNIIAVLKRKTNKLYGFKMWQDRYHDHVIRSENEYSHIWKYIDENSLNWETDEYSTRGLL